MPRTVLIADDDHAVRTVLATALARAGFSVRACGTGATLWRWIEEGQGDLAILDVLLPDTNGLELIPRIKRLRGELQIIIISAEATLATAVQAAERGAFDYLAKPFDLDALVSLAGRALADPARAPPREGSGERPALIGRSRAMQGIYRSIARLASTDLTAMIVGESGTGKELVARALHEYGKRRGGPFVALNMAAIPRELVESELFGHERGAFTGAFTRSRGRFEEADGGTLFLDEVGDMPLDAQTRLLRVLQEREFHTLGGHAAVRVDVRIVAATHRDLKRLIKEGLFREDLFYRLNVVPLRLPPLRARVQDIAPLAEHFLALARSQGLPEKRLAPEAIARLESYPWPGNVRELENLMRRLAALLPEEIITGAAISSELDEADAAADAHPDGGGARPLAAVLEQRFRTLLAAGEAGGIYQRARAEFEGPLIRAALAASHGNQVHAATMLGLNRNTLRKKMRELAIPIVKGVG